MSDPLKEKAFAFALRMVKLADFLQKERKEYSISKKILDSGVILVCSLKKRGKVMTGLTFAQSIHSPTKRLSRVIISSAFSMLRVS